MKRIIILLYIHLQTYFYRTPLNCSISMLEILKSELLLTDSVLTKRYIDPALQSNKILHFLVNDLLDYSQI